MLLIDLPRLSAPLEEVDKFCERQKNRCHEVVQKLKSQWFEEVCTILREELLGEKGGREHDTTVGMFVKTA